MTRPADGPRAGLEEANCLSLFILQNNRACVLQLAFDVVEFGFRLDPSLSVSAIQLLIARKQMGNTVLFSLRSQFL